MNAFLKFFVLYRIIEMGNPASKIGQEIKEIEVTQGSVSSTPISTPKVSRSQKSITDCDPRSPSANIVRTPILVSFFVSFLLALCFCNLESFS